MFPLPQIAQRIVRTTSKHNAKQCASRVHIHTAGPTDSKTKSPHQTNMPNRMSKAHPFHNHFETKVEGCNGRRGHAKHCTQETRQREQMGGHCMMAWPRKKKRRESNGHHATRKANQWPEQGQSRQGLCVQARLARTASWHCHNIVHCAAEVP